MSDERISVCTLESVSAARCIDCLDKYGPTCAITWPTGGVISIQDIMNKRFKTIKREE